MTPRFTRDDFDEEAHIKAQMLMEERWEEEYHEREYAKREGL